MNSLRFVLYILLALFGLQLAHSLPVGVNKRRTVRTRERDRPGQNSRVKTGSGSHSNPLAHHTTSSTTLTTTTTTTTTTPVFTASLGQMIFKRKASEGSRKKLDVPQIGK